MLFDELNKIRDLNFNEIDEKHRLLYHENKIES